MNGSFSVWWENKTRKDKFAASENEKHLKEIRKLKEASARAAGWADKNERTKIGYDPIKEHDRGNGSRSYIGAKTKKMQSRVKQMEKRIGREIREKEGLLKDLELPRRSEAHKAVPPQVGACGGQGLQHTVQRRREAGF